MSDKRNRLPPEESSEEPRILAPEEDALRAELRLERQEEEGHPRWPRGDDALRQAGESSPDPKRS